MKSLQNLLAIAVSGLALTFAGATYAGEKATCCKKASCCCNGGDEACCKKEGKTCCTSCDHCER